MTMTAEQDERAVAVIGMACRFPGARDVDQYWSNLVSGRSALGPSVGAGWDGVSERGSAPADQHPDYVPVSGTLDDFDLFDAGFFGVSPAEATSMDPQQRLFLQEAVRALEHAGWTGAGSRNVGVFCGSGENRYAGLPDHQGRAAVPDSPSTLPLRVSYHLDLHGPSVFVSSLCSTSLAAVHLARGSLLAGDCDVALAGAVSLRLPLHHGYHATAGGVASPDGELRPFDRRASGTVPGSGVGVVVLKRLAHALRDGDTVHAVLRGSALNNDGADRQSFAAPSVRGQRDVIIAALADSGVDPGSIGYVEAHGTGTPLGDPVEMAALREAREFLDVRTPCVVGAVKSSVGHLDSAAGMAGLVKAVLAVREGTVPPTHGHEELNPEIRLEGTGLRVGRRAQPWPQPSLPRRAAVTALGIGGTNAHVVLEQPPAARPALRAPDRARIFPVSAHSTEAFERLRTRLADRVAELPRADVARTLQSHRIAKPLRRAWVLAPAADLGAALREPVRPVAPQPFVLAVDARSLPSTPLGTEFTEGLPTLRALLTPGIRAPYADFFRSALWALDALAGVPVLLGHGAGEYLAVAAAGGMPADTALRCALLHVRAVEAGRPGSDLSACERLLDSLAKELWETALSPLVREVRSGFSGHVTAAGHTPSGESLLEMTRGEVMGTASPQPSGEHPDLFAALGSWDRWLALIAHSWERGVEVDWDVVCGPATGRITTLVPYPFDEVRHWPVPPTAGAEKPGTRAPALPSAGADPETEVAAIWRDVLGVPQVRPDDSFFHLGGHSLLASQVMARIWDGLGVRVSLGDLLEAETLRAMADLVEEKLSSARLFASLSVTDDGNGAIEL